MCEISDEKIRILDCDWRPFETRSRVSPRFSRRLARVAERHVYGADGAAGY